MSKITLFEYINKIYNFIETATDQNKKIIFRKEDKRYLDFNYWDTMGRLGKYYIGQNADYFCDHIELSFFKREDVLLENIEEVISIAGKLANYTSSYEVHEQIRKSNQHGSSSKNIQDILVNFLKELGFESEKKGLFKYHNLRPDYYKKLDKGGIIFEVERGKTITNNMDFYDLWKCHICEEANHLFLFVPQNVSHTKNIYDSTKKRFKTFFQDEKNHINIDTIFLFGY